MEVAHIGGYFEGAWPHSTSRVCRLGATPLPNHRATQADRYHPAPGWTDARSPSAGNTVPASTRAVTPDPSPLCFDGLHHLRQPTLESIHLTSQLLHLANQVDEVLAVECHGRAGLEHGQGPAQVTSDEFRAPSMPRHAPRTPPPSPASRPASLPIRATPPAPGMGLGSRRSPSRHTPSGSSHRDAG